MEHASAIYWGGDLISAADCDYESYRSTGTVCPFCSGAVFLRAGGVRKVNDREVPFRACFAHFNAGEEADLCEARSISSQGKQELEAIRTAKKKQRLVLFNGQLWDLFETAKGLNSSRKLKKKIAQEPWDPLVRNVRAALKREMGDFLVISMEEMARIVSVEQEDIGDILRANRQRLYGDPDVQRGLSTQAAEAKINYFRKASMVKHFEICAEILDFLTTASGAGALKMFALRGLHLSTELNPDLFRGTIVPDDPEIMSSVAEIIVYSIAFVRWGEVLENAQSTKKGFGSRKAS